MALFGTFTYGTSVLYGATGDNTNLLYGVRVDWDEDGYYDANEAPDRLLKWFSRRGRENYLRDSDEGGFAPYREGEVVIELDNRDQRYNPLNTSSPIYPNVAEGTPPNVITKDGSAGTREDLITGQIDDIDLVGNGADAKAVITIVDGWNKLRADEVSIAIQEDVLTSDAIDAVLDATEWPGIYGRNIGIASQTIAYWWEDGRSPSAALKDLADSEFGRFYIARNGNAVFASRHQIDESVVTLQDATSLKDVGLANVFKSYRDKVSIKVQPLSPQATSEVWRHREIPVVPAGQAIQIWAEFSFEGKIVPVINPISPVATTDYTANTAAVGSGSNLTADIVVTPTWFGSRALLNVQNNNGSDAHLTLIKVRADALASLDASYAISGEGKRIFKLELPWQQAINFANDLAEYLVDLLSSKRPRPIIRLETRFEEQFTPDLTSKVTGSSPSLEIADDYRIGYIEHESGETVQEVRTMFKLEPFAVLTGSWQFPTEIGVTSSFGL